LQILIGKGFDVSEKWGFASFALLDAFRESLHWRRQETKRRHK
jgi:hypothetical protein